MLIFVRQWNNIDANHEVIEAVLAEVRQIRASTAWNSRHIHVSV